MKSRTRGFAFRVLATDGQARRAILTTPHGEVDTPTFMPVGTQGSVKTLTPEEVASTGARVVLANTYHLWLRPGAEAVNALGRLHGFTRWPHAMLTDSGGFQAFSLGAGAKTRPSLEGNDRRASAVPATGLVRLDEDGFTFRSHLDGSRRHLSPEGAVTVQGLLGADIQMQLDVCPPGGSARAVVEEAVARTSRWAVRALATPRPEGQALFGIVQGGSFPDLRRAHAALLGSLEDPAPFDGLALGGFSVGEPIAEMYETLAEVGPCLDAERPRYLMGVGTPIDLLEGISHGIDMFDCVLPTRNARNGQALTRFGKVVIKQARYRDDPAPIDPACGCAACMAGYSRAYLRHLYLAKEILVLRLFSLHNLHFYGELMAGARAAIARGDYPAWKRARVSEMTAGG